MSRTKHQYSIPIEFFHTTYKGSKYPGSSGLRGLGAGANCQHFVYELLRKFALERLNHQVHLVKGHAGEAIAELATTKRVELIVMGTLCRTGIEGFFMGYTA